MQTSAALPAADCLPTPTSASDEPPFYIPAMEHRRLDPDDPDPGADGVWDRARREYLAGVTAAAICQRYGMSLRSFRLHARAGRWRRIDRPDCDVAPEPEEFHPDDAVSFADLADQAFLNLRRAIGAGRAGEAAGWLRLFDRLADRARGEVLADLPDMAPPRSAQAPECDRVRESARRLSVDDGETPSDDKALADEPDAEVKALHLLHPVFFESRFSSARPDAAPDAGAADPAPRRGRPALGP